jgi:hypothetical protein
MNLKAPVFAKRIQGLGKVLLGGQCGTDTFIFRRSCTAGFSRL